jgi:hypothetical protein
VQEVVFVAGIEGITQGGVRVFVGGEVVVKIVQVKRLYQQRAKGVVEREAAARPKSPDPAA